MDGCYDILLGTEIVGSARVTSQGLYRCFECRCKFTGRVMFRLTVTCGGRTENLGLPVPEGNEFVLRTRIPAKRLGVGLLEIRAVPKHPELEGQFVPVSPEEPFRYLARLKGAVLEKRDGVIGIRIIT